MLEEFVSRSFAPLSVEVIERANEKAEERSKAVLQVAADRWGEVIDFLADT